MFVLCADDIFKCIFLYWSMRFFVVPFFCLFFFCLVFFYTVTLFDNFFYNHCIIAQTVLWMNHRTYKSILKKKILIFKNIPLYTIFIAFISSCPDVHWSPVSLTKVHLKKTCDIQMTVPNDSSIKGSICFSSRYKIFWNCSIKIRKAWKCFWFYTLECDIDVLYWGSFYYLASTEIHCG